MTIPLHKYDEFSIKSTLFQFCEDRDNTIAKFPYSVVSPCIAYPAKMVQVTWTRVVTSVWSYQAFCGGCN